MKVKLTFFVAAMLALMATGSAMAGGRIYKWTDEKGVTHYGESIPPEYRDQAATEMNQRGLALRKILYPSLLGRCGRNVVFGQNVVRPPGEDAVPAVTCSDAVQDESTCRLQGSRSGRYEADLTALGMQPGHVAVDVPSRSILPGECCPVGYVPQFTQVGLNFAN
jgi:hypothetical protein